MTWLLAVALAAWTALPALAAQLPVDSLVAPGVSRELAGHRSARIHDLTYHYDLEIPAERDAPIRGVVAVRFELRPADGPVILDFAQPAERLGAVHVNGRAVEAELDDGHIVLPAAAMLPGPNTVRIEFVAGDAPLNRQDGFLYTLFVPARAREAVPIFDQPDLKGRFSLTLTVPAGWTAVANAPRAGRTEHGARVRYRFARTAPISSYLFAFAVGEFRVERGVRDGRELTMYHRETDAEKVARNRDAIFDLHAAALRWLESYTGIPYPFEKFAFVLIPAFQYSGMEHPGSVLYRASRLLLDESATESQKLGRASLIAHETAHMWFGDLVTMAWFDDVWMKEVFANFMAAKIVHPSFPDIDHELRFFLAHYPAAYDVDRTAGANPIRQELENLDEAGSLYGAIIYQKAPIMMRQLERLVGEERFRSGIRRYLDGHRYGNASWSDLITILDRLSGADLERWSRVWVDEPGRPTLRPRLDAERGRIRSLVIRQEDPVGDRIWDQTFDVLLGDVYAATRIPVRLDSPRVAVDAARDRPVPDFLLLDDAYGRLAADAATLRYVGVELSRLVDAEVRGLAWLTLWDAMLEGEIEPEWLLDAALDALSAEDDPLVIQRMVDDVETVFWRFLSPERRAAWAAQVDDVLWTEVGRRERTSVKSTFFDAWRSVVLTPAGVDRMRAAWREGRVATDFELSERDRTRLAYELAVRGAPDSSELLAEQRQRIDNPDRRAALDFVVPALSPDPAVRDSVFRSLAEPENRRREPWVLTAVSYLHHPLRAAESRRYIRPSLELIEEIQRTGDIFFPLRFLYATLDGHQSRDAAREVTEFLAAHPELPERLRGKVLQAADPLFRAARMVDGVEAREPAGRE